MKIHIVNRQFIIIGMITIVLALCALIIPANAKTYDTIPDNRETIEFSAESSGSVQAGLSGDDGLCQESTHISLPDIGTYDCQTV